MQQRTPDASVPRARAIQGAQVIVRRSPARITSGKPDVWGEQGADRILVIDSVACIRTTGCARLVDGDARQQRQARFECDPHPAGNVLARRILETLDIVEVAMIELIEQRCKSRTDIGEIGDPAGIVTHWSGQVHLDPERVSVQASTLVVGGNARQAVRGLDAKHLENIHARRFSEMR